MAFKRFFWTPFRHSKLGGVLKLRDLLENFAFDNFNSPWRVYGCTDLSKDTQASYG